MSDAESAACDAARYIASYLSLASQPPDEAPSDAQLATLMLPLAQRLAAARPGAVFDVGCGQGALLARLLMLPAFEQGEWLYVGIDTERHLDSVQRIARQNRINRRVELVELSSFYDTWPRVADHQIVVVRNVLHELNIVDTAQLLFHVRSHLLPGDTLLIQDLMCLPVGERHMACWAPDDLAGCLSAIGLSITAVVPQGTRSGNVYFNIVAEALSEGIGVTSDECRGIVTAARRRQWEMWDQLERDTANAPSARGELVQALDVDLQLAALTRQLRDVGVLTLSLDSELQGRVRASTFTGALQALARKGIKSATLIAGHPHFRERGEQLTALESFLRSDGRLAVVYGGPGSGKTTLVNRLLSTRSYEKSVVVVDGQRARGFWSFLESVFAPLGFNLEPEVLSVLGNLEMSSIEPALRGFFNAHAQHLIIFYDNFESVLDTNGEIGDPALLRLLAMIISKPGIKMVVAGRSASVPSALHWAAAPPPVEVRVGRYATDQTVVNVLDDYFDRRAAGLNEYPAELLAAIDRHPLIAVLAGHNLQRSGPDVLMDSLFVHELQLKLKDQLWSRLVDPGARSAVMAASQLRVPVPIDLLRAVAPRDSVSAAQQTEVIHGSKDARWDMLWSVLGVFRAREAPRGSVPEDSAQDPESAKPGIDHGDVARLYGLLYRSDDDPKWIRESYYHRMLGGEALTLTRGLGKYYFDEILASADYRFVRHRDFAGALELYDVASGIAELREQSAMRRASCLVRTRRRREGDEAYRNLCVRFPRSKGIRMSHVDALLYLQDYASAGDALTRYGFHPQDGEWVAWQWGRVFFGLHRYSEAITVFEDLTRRPDPDPHYFVHLARAYRHNGQFASAVSVMRRGRERFPEDIGIATELGVQLEDNGLLQEAQTLLADLVEARSDNVRAALSLLRIRLQAGDIASARRVLFGIGKEAPPELAGLFLVARAEMYTSEGRLQLAIQCLESADMRDASIAEQLLLAYERWVATAVVSPGDAKLKNVVKLLSDETFSSSAPIQLAKAQLAIAVRREDAFRASLKRLTATGVDPCRIRGLEEAWERAGRSD